MRPPTHPLVRAREAIAEAAVDFSPFSLAEADFAACLLDSLWCAALRHDVDPDELAVYTDLGALCLHVASARRTVR
ncbi:MAG: hypothetical protein ACRDPT_13525 [Streptomycetales bacterium]